MISAGGEGREDESILGRQEGQETHKNFGQSSKVTARQMTDRISHTEGHPEKGGQSRDPQQELDPTAFLHSLVHSLTL